MASDEKLSAEAAAEAAAVWSPVKALQRTAATITTPYVGYIVFSLVALCLRETVAPQMRKLAICRMHLCRLCSELQNLQREAAAAWCLDTQQQMDATDVHNHTGA